MKFTFRKPSLRAATCWIAFLAALVVCGVFLRSHLKPRSGTAAKVASGSSDATPDANQKAAPVPEHKKNRGAFGGKVRSKDNASGSKVVLTSGAGVHPAADVDPMEKLLAGQPFLLVDRGQVVSFELALDEIWLPSQPAGERLLKVETQADAASLIRLAESKTAAEKKTPNLVIYPTGRPRTETSRRIVTDQLLLRVSDVTAAEKIAKAAGLQITSQPGYAPEYVIAEARTSSVASGLGALPRLSGQKGIISAAPFARPPAGETNDHSQ